MLAVLGTTLRGERPAAGYAVPLATAEPLSELLRHNAATVPCHGRDLNLAGVLELTATATAAATDCDAFPPDPADFADPADLAGSAEPPGPAAPATTCPAPVERAECARRLARFTDGPALVLAVVGVPGSGRTTALAAHCARRARGTPAPTVWLRGADLRDGDDSVADAVGRALGRASRVVAASGAPGDVTTATPQRVAALAREAGRPLLIVLDGPEEMPPGLAQRLTVWTTGTGRWLRAHGARLVLGCRPEHWEQARPLYPPGSVDDPVPLGDLTEAEARTARRRYGLGDAGLAAEDARHPLALRLLAEVRRALPGEVPGRPGRDEILTAYLDLKCLRTAVRIAAGSPAAPRGAAVRRLAAKVSGRVHEAARRSLGPGQGALDRESFEELFPWRDGWARAVLTEGIVVPAGDGYRFGHEEVADWLQGAHLDVDAALRHLAVPGPAARGRSGPRRPSRATASAPSSRPCCCSPATAAPRPCCPGWRAWRGRWTGTRTRTAPEVTRRGGRRACSPAPSSRFPTPGRASRSCVCWPTSSAAGGRNAPKGTRTHPPSPSRAAPTDARRPAPGPRPARRTAPDDGPASRRRSPASAPRSGRPCASVRTSAWTCCGAW